MLPRVKVWGEARKAILRARWREEPGRQDLDWWREFFRGVADSDFLCGRSGNGSFIASLEWLVRPKNFPKVLEGNYRNRQAARSRAEEIRDRGPDAVLESYFGGDMGRVIDAEVVGSGTG